MKDKKKVVLASSIILGSLILIFGISYAVLSYEKEGETQELIVGDIYMHYNETNELVISDVMPTSIDKYTTYKVNPVMSNQEKRVSELTKCVIAYQNYWDVEYLDEGSTIESFCKGEGTIFNGTTFQKYIVGFLDDESFLEYEMKSLLYLGVFIQDDGDYILNPVMKHQTVEEVNNLTTCIVDYSYYEFDEGTTAKSYCQGSGTAYGGMTLQEDLDAFIEFVEEMGDNFLEVGGQELLDKGIIIQDGENYLVNPIMATQEYVESNELTKCVDYLINLGFENEFDTILYSYCKREGMLEESTFQENLDNITYTTNELKEMENLNIIIPQIENLPYFEFIISGKNTYEKEDIWYEIVLTHGDSHDTRNTRIRDDLLKFTLVEVIDDGTELILLNNIKCNNFSNKRIWAETIKANTTSEINKKYRLYVWISEDTVIGNNNQDYTFREWQDVYASIKINVTGDFKEKEVQFEYGEMYDVTDASCFETKTITTYTHNSNMTEEELNTCVTLFENWGYGMVSGEDWESYCSGNGTRYGYTFQENLDREWLFEYPTKLSILEENNIIINNGVLGIRILDYDKKCGSDIVIPKTINGYNVIEIASNSFDSKELTSVVIPNTIEKLGHKSFYNNLIIDIRFEENSKLNYIYDKSFGGQNKLIEVTLPNSVTYFECDAFNDDVIINKNEELICTAGPS